MPDTPAHNPKLIAVLAAAATSATGRAVRLRSVQPAAGRSNVATPPPGPPPSMTPGIAADLPNRKEIDQSTSSEDSS